MSWIGDHNIKEALRELVISAGESPPHDIARLVNRIPSWSYYKNQKPVCIGYLNVFWNKDDNAAAETSQVFDVWHYNGETGFNQATLPHSAMQYLGRFDATCGASLVTLLLEIDTVNSPLSYSGTSGRRFHVQTKDGWYVGGWSLPSMYLDFNVITGFF